MQSIPGFIVPTFARATHLLEWHIATGAHSASLLHESSEKTGDFTPDDPIGVGAASAALLDVFGAVSVALLVVVGAVVVLPTLVAVAGVEGAGPLDGHAGRARAMKQRPMESKCRDRMRRLHHRFPRAATSWMHPDSQGPAPRACAAARRFSFKGR